MSTLVFDGSAHTLTLRGSTGQQVGQWHANNRVDHRATIRFVPNQTYRIIDPAAPHRHGGAADTLNGPYGRFGIIRLAPFAADGSLHDGVGVHSGRANRGGADHPTMGCIRTTDEAMAAISQHMRGDPVQTITVQGNHLQAAVSAHRGDPHPPSAHDHHPAHPAHRSRKAHHAVSPGHSRPDYAKLFSTCVIDPTKAGVIDRMAGKIIDNKARYQAVATAAGGTVPWWFVGLVHMLEANLSFKAHLHNGDPLTARTVHVPAGRPTHGEPPFSWEESAEDALRYQGLTKVSDWSLANALHRLEGYNGYGYQSHGVNSPYLWSYSNHYTKGKYVRDGVFDATAVSQQAGAAVVLKRLVERGAVTLG